MTVRFQMPMKVSIKKLLPSLDIECEEDDFINFLSFYNQYGLMTDQKRQTQKKSKNSSVDSSSSIVDSNNI